MTAPLIVPLNVDACVFSDQSATLDLRQMDYADGFNNYITPEPAVLPDPPAAIIPYRLHRRGITVFWTLPYALRTGRQTDVELEFDTLPNRWLVVRTNTADAGGATWQSRAWVVASDYVGTAITDLEVAEYGIQWAQPGQQGFEPTTLGAVMRIDDFRELGATGRDRTPPLDVTSGGTELFVSFEPYCRNMFSFQDPLDGLEDDPATYSYCVVGWYSEREIDPIAGLAQAADGDVPAFLAALVARTGWTPVQTPQDVPPTALYFGAIDDIDWTPEQQPPSMAPDRDDVLVVVGQSADDTLDTMLDYASGDGAAAFSRELSRQGLRFTAGVRDMLGDFEDLGGLSRQMTEDHASAFAALRNQTVWQVRQPQRQDGSDTPVVTIPAAVRLSLARLNAVEEERFKLHARIVQQRGIVADTLWKAGRLKAQGAGAFPPALGTMDEYWANIRRELGYSGTQDRTTLMGALVADQSREADLSAQIIALTTAIRADLAVLGEDYTLEDGSGARYWHTMDPVVMLTTDKGTLFPEAADPQFFGEDGLAVGIALPDTAEVVLTPGSTTCAVNPAAVWQMLDIEGDVIGVLDVAAPQVAPWIASIVGWSLLGDPAIGPAALNAATGTVTTSADLRAALQTDGPAAGVVFDPLTNLEWRQPWFPLFLEWRVDATHFPLFTDSGQSNWRFDGTDYEITATATAQGSATLLQGRTLLSSHLRRTVGSALRTQLSDFGADPQEIAELLAQLDKWDFLTQRLSGLSETLTLYEGELKPIGHEAAMAPPGGGGETPPPDPAPWDRAGPYTALPGTRDLVLPTLADQWNPNNTSRFRDLSGQQMVIDQLLVLDRFGQTLHVAGKFEVEQDGRTLTDANMVVSDALAAQSNLTRQPARDIGTVVQTPPRVLQTIRATLETPDTVRDATGAVTALQNPLIGFVTLNRYNKEIQIFSEMGHLLGAIHPGLGGTVVFEPLGTQIQALADLQEGSPDLFRFVSAIVNDGVPGRYEDLSTLLDAAGWRIDPASEREAYLSVLTGEPLALYRAEFDFDMAGTPLRNPFRYFPFESGVTGNDLPSYAGQQFPFLMGNPLDPDDGMVGYYLDDDFGRFYTPYDPVDDPVTDYISVVGGANAPTHSFAAGPRQVTVLANPHGMVELRTGIAPVQRMRLDDRYWTGPLALMNPSFSFGPMLAEYETDEAGGLTGILLPQSNIEAGHLNWQVEQGRSVPVLQSDAASGTTTRPRAFLWGRVVLDIRGDPGAEG